MMNEELLIENIYQYLRRMICLIPILMQNEHETEILVI